MKTGISLCGFANIKSRQDINPFYVSAFAVIPMSKYQIVFVHILFFYYRVIKYQTALQTFIFPNQRLNL